VSFKETIEATTKKGRILNCQSRAERLHSTQIGWSRFDQERSPEHCTALGITEEVLYQPWKTKKSAETVFNFRGGNSGK
jgi:hypothetical protein